MTSPAEETMIDSVRDIATEQCCLIKLLLLLLLSSLQDSLFDAFRNDTLRLFAAPAIFVDCDEFLGGSWACSEVDVDPLDIPDAGGCGRLGGALSQRPVEVCASLGRARIRVLVVVLTITSNCDTEGLRITVNGFDYLI